MTLKDSTNCCHAASISCQWQVRAEHHLLRLLAVWIELAASAGANELPDPCLKRVNGNNTMPGQVQRVKLSYNTAVTAVQDKLSAYTMRRVQRSRETGWVAAERQVNHNVMQSTAWCRFKQAC
jgi:hypothetical protein